MALQCYCTARQLAYHVTAIHIDTQPQLLEGAHKVGCIGHTWSSREQVAHMQQYRICSAKNRQNSMQYEGQHTRPPKPRQSAEAEQSACQVVQAQ